jgi:hypothetical protein
LSIAYQTNSRLCDPNLVTVCRDTGLNPETERGKDRVPLDAVRDIELMKPLAAQGEFLGSRV